MRDGGDSRRNISIRSGFMIARAPSGATEGRGVSSKMRLIGIGGALVAVLAGATLASGAALKEKSVGFAVAGPDGIADGTAKCKRKQTAVSGGFFNDLGVAGTNPQVIALDSTRQGKRGWRLEATNVSDPDGTATAYVYCSKKKRKLTTVRGEDESIAPQQVGDAEASCEGKRTAVSGGFEVDGGRLSVLASSLRVGKKGWEVTFGNGNANTIEVTAVVYCAKGKKKIKTKATDGDVENMASEELTAKCSKRQQLVSGGFEHEFDLSTNVAAVPRGSRRLGKRKWELSSLGIGGTADASVFAYCEKKKRKKGK